MKANTYLLAVILVGLVALIGCKRNDPEKEGPCGVKDPTTELPWLKKEIENLSKPPLLDYAYFTTKYKGERVFWKYFSGSSDFSRYRSCDGTIKSLSSNLKEDDYETKQFRNILRNPTLACPYVLWSTSYFKQLTNCK